MGQKIPEKEIVKQKFCKNFERGRLLVRRARRCNREDLEQFQFVWVTDRLRFGGCLRWFVGKGQYGEGLKSVKKNAALLHFLAFLLLDHTFGVLRGEQPLRRGCGVAQRSKPQRGFEPHERASSAGWRPSFWPPSALPRNSETFSLPFWSQKGRC